MEKERIENVLRTELSKDDMKQIRTYYLRFYNNPEKYSNTDMVGLVLMDIGKTSDPNWVEKAVKESTKSRGLDTNDNVPLSLDDFHATFTKVESNKQVESAKSIRSVGNCPMQYGPILSMECRKACDDLIHLCYVHVSQFSLFEYYNGLGIAAYLTLKIPGLTVDDKKLLFKLVIRFVHSTYWNCYHIAGGSSVAEGVKIVYEHILSELIRTGDYIEVGVDDFNRIINDHKDYGAKEVSSPRFSEYRKWLFARKESAAELDASITDMSGYQKSTGTAIERQLQKWESCEKLSTYKGLNTGDKVYDEFVNKMTFAYMSSRSIGGDVAGEQSQALTRYAAPYIISETAEEGLPKKSGSVSKLLDKAGG